MKRDDLTLIEALRVLAAESQSDGFANACIAEAADRLDELTAGHITIPGCVGVITMLGDTEASRAAQAVYLPEQEIRVKP